MDLNQHQAEKLKIMQTVFQKLSDWYERHYTLNIGIVAGLFVWQLLHLYWLTVHVIAERLFGMSYFELQGFWEFLIVLVDYTEIPAIIAVSLVYIYELSKKLNGKSVLFLLFINSQWLHLLWITDEFIIEQFAQTGIILFPLWLVWTAILIDYLELPVIFDTMKKFLVSLKKSNGGLLK